MYRPKEFDGRQTEIQNEFIQHIRFHQILVVANNEVEVAYAPLIAKKDQENGWIFEGHLALANPCVVPLTTTKKASLILNGEHGYVSSSVYEKENVPTWNYEAAQIRCTVEQLTAVELDQHLDELVKREESGRQTPLNYKNFNPAMIAEYKTEIVGLRFKSTEIQMVQKLSQNRSENDFKAIIEDVDNRAMAERMKGCPIKH